jgi:hypothetical protein
VQFTVNQLQLLQQILLRILRRMYTDNVTENTIGNDTDNVALNVAQHDYYLQQLWIGLPATALSAATGTATPAAASTQLARAALL